MYSSHCHTHSDHSTPPDYFIGASYDGAATEMFTIPFSTEIGDMTIDVRIEQEG